MIELERRYGQSTGMCDKMVGRTMVGRKKLILSAVSKANSTARNVFLNFYPPSLSRAIKKRQKTNKVFMVLSLVAIVSSFEENRLE